MPPFKDNDGPQTKNLSRLYSRVGFMLKWNLAIFILANLVFLLLFVLMGMVDLRDTSILWKEYFLDRVSVMESSTKDGAAKGSIPVVHRLLIAADGTILEAPLHALKGIRLNPSGLFGKIHYLQPGNTSIVFFPDLVDGEPRVHFIRGVVDGFVVSSLDPKDFFPVAMLATMKLFVATDGIIRFSEDAGLIGNIDRSRPVYIEDGRLYVSFSASIPGMPSSRLVIAQDISGKASVMLMAALALSLLLAGVTLHAGKIRHDFYTFRHEHTAIVTLIKGLSTVAIREGTAEPPSSAQLRPLLEQAFGDMREADLQFQEHRRFFRLLRDFSDEVILLLDTVVKDGERLLAGEARFRAVVMTASDAIITTDMRNCIVFWNGAAEGIFGYPADEAIGMYVDRMVHPEFEAIGTGRSEGGTGVLGQGANGRTVASIGLTKAGREFPLEMSIAEWSAPSGTFMTLIVRDVSERKLAEEKIRKSMFHKEVLLQELFHRTNNNMNVIIALLGMQAGYHDDRRLQEAFKDAQDRIGSMALAHRRLYENEDLSYINLKGYIEDLIALLLQSYRDSACSVSFVHHMEDVSVLIDTAIPCGLILNELVTNALKHAFPDGRTGTVTIDLHRDASGGIMLRVADDGIGIEPGFRYDRDGRIGLKDMLAMGASQLKATIDLDTVNGVDCRLRFRDNLYKARV